MTFDLLALFYGWMRPTSRIHPYYEKRLEEANTFLSGAQIAKELSLLESLAKEGGRRQLTSLEFSPLPIKRRTLRWNLAEDGIKVLQDQLFLVSEFWDRFENPALLRDEFEKILLALRAASRLDIKFTLVRKFGNWTNAMEWEDGGGSV